MCQSTITWSLPAATVEGSIEFTHPEKPVRGGNAFALLADVAGLSELGQQPWQAALGVMPPLHVHVLADLASNECHDGMGRSQRRCVLLNTHIRSTRIALDDAGLMHTSSPHTSYNKLETLCEEDDEEASQHGSFRVSQHRSNLTRPKREQDGLDILAEQKKRIVS
jgi:hypothetical protein